MAVKIDFYFYSLQWTPNTKASWV